MITMILAMTFCVWILAGAFDLTPRDFFLVRLNTLGRLVWQLMKSWDIALVWLSAELESLQV